LNQQVQKQAFGTSKRLWSLDVNMDVKLFTTKRHCGVVESSTRSIFFNFDFFPIESTANSISKWQIQERHNSDDTSCLLPSSSSYAPPSTTYKSQSFGIALVVRLLEICAIK
jgi:hypothetical protein